MQSGNISSAEESFICSRILAARGETDRAIDVLYALNHFISEVMFSPDNRSGNETE